MLDRRTFLGRRGRRRSPCCSPRRTSRSRRRRPTAASSSSSSAAPPTGSAPWRRPRDPAFAGLRGAFAEDFAGGARLGDFTLHPALGAGRAALCRAREALFVHAVASPYRDRSHFDGQNVLETGGSAAYALRDGWMNRLLGLLPGRRRPRDRGLGDGADGAARQRARSPPTRPRPCPTPRTTCSPASPRSTRATASCTPPGRRRCRPATMAGDLSGDDGRNGAATGALAARLLAGADGRADRGDRDRRLGHPRQSARPARLPAARPRRHARRAQDRARRRLGRAPWSSSPPNSAAPPRPTAPAAPITAPASLAMLLGGAVAGGRVVADWPGLGAVRAPRRPRPQADARTSTR